MAVGRVAAGAHPPQAQNSARLGAWLALVALLSTLAYAANAGDEPPDDFVYRWESLWNALPNLVLLGIAILIAGWPRTLEMLALRPPQSWWRALGLGTTIVIAVVVFEAALSRWLQPGEEQGLVPTGWDGGRAPQFFANFALIVLLVPIVEELTFRGVGFTLLRRFGRWPAILVVGLSFGLVHGLVEALPVLTLFGAVLAFLRERTGSVLPCIVVHGAFNALALAVSIAH
ncbi:MAG: lysostaphin resistance A-like protein [Gaiellaceae bacterium]